MENLEIYNKGMVVPQEALKPILAGRLKGMSDINPMWRIQKLTELFGPCGIGWYTEVIDKRIEQGAGGELAAFVDINLYIKVDGEWSRPIFGTGGNMLVAQEKNGLHTSDEAYKMAYTDALSVACKSLGFGASVYWQLGGKYSQPQYQTQGQNQPQPQPQQIECKCVECGKVFTDCTTASGTFISAQEATKRLASKCVDGLPRCTECARKAGKLING